MKQKFVKTTSIFETKTSGETVALDADKGEYHGFNAVGTRAFELWSEAKTVEEICELLLTEYDVEPNMCSVQISEFCEELLGRGLLVPITE